MSLSFGVNQALVEDQLRRYLSNPESVDEDWRAYFEGLPEDEKKVLFGANGAGASAAEPERSPKAPPEAPVRPVVPRSGPRDATSVELAWRTSVASASPGHNNRTRRTRRSPSTP